MDSARNKTIAAIVVNALVVVLEIWAIRMGIMIHGVAGNFIFYTQCSNLLGGIACALCLIAEVRSLGSQHPGDVPQAFRWIKYAASCCLLLTFLVVIAVLAPMLESVGQPGYYLMFVDGAKPVTHLIGPLLVAGSYIAFEADTAMTLRQSLIGFVPTLIYAAIAYACNIARVWDGPYPFFQVWNMPIWMSILWFVVLFIVAFALCQVPRLIARRIGRTI